MSTGRIQSFQSLGTVDGPGVRFVVFLQGCPLSCHCCHNPETRPFEGGTAYTAEEVVSRAARYREYFGNQGGITLTGGEPLCQPSFCREVFRLCHEQGIHTCLDTSGFVLNEAVKAVLDECDRVLLDIKYTEEDTYRRYVGCSLSQVTDFLTYLNERRIPTTLRQVIIPTVNDTEDGVRRLRELAAAHACVDSVELLPFRKLCQTKYDALGLPFLFGHLPEADGETMARLNALLTE